MEAHVAWRKGDHIIARQSKVKLVPKLLLNSVQVGTVSLSFSVVQAAAARL
jgi:hypothetical protein